MVLSKKSKKHDCGGDCCKTKCCDLKPKRKRRVKRKKKVIPKINLTNMYAYRQPFINPFTPNPYDVALQNLLKPKKQTISVGTNTFSGVSVGTDAPLFPELNALPILGNNDESEDEEFKEYESDYVSEDEVDLPFIDEDEYEVEGVTDENSKLIVPTKQKKRNALPLYIQQEINDILEDYEYSSKFTHDEQDTIKKYYEELRPPNVQGGRPQSIDGYLRATNKYRKQRSLLGEKGNQKNEFASLKRIEKGNQKNEFAA